MVIEPNTEIEEFKIGFIKDEYDEYDKIKAKGIGCVANVKDNVIYTHHVPIKKYHRRYPKSRIGTLSFSFEDCIKDPISLSEKLVEQMSVHLDLQKER